MSVASQERKRQNSGDGCWGGISSDFIMGLLVVEHGRHWFEPIENLKPLKPDEGVKTELV
jgi:hypothetical protein